MFASAGGLEIARSESLQFIHGSEVAFWSNAEDVIPSVFMASSLEKGTRIILESTSNGKNNIFYDLCQEALTGKSDFELIFIPWFWHKDYQIDPQGWEPSIEWLEYKSQYNLSLSQLRWAYLKNQILCKVTGEDTENGPSIIFKREFPADYHEAFLDNNNDNSLIPWVLLREATLDDLNLTDNNSLNHIIKQKIISSSNREIVLGLDVARGGDESWIIDRQGDFLGFKVNQKINLNDVMQVAYWAAEYVDRLNASKLFVDAGSMGIAVVDRLRELGFSNIVVPVYFGGKSSDNRRFANKRAEMWFRLKEFLINGGHIVNHSDLLRQINSAKAFYNIKGQIQLLEKKIIKVKGVSPDGGDAAALTFAQEHNNQFNFKTKNDDCFHEYNPWEW